jgi:hypothetical protein
VLREKAVATGIVTQLDLPLLESWTRPPVDFRSIDPLEKTRRLVESTTRTLPLRWLCGRAGAFYVSGPQHFSGVLGKGPRTWFAASLQLHDLRRVVITSFLRSKAATPAIDAERARLIARCWSSVFGWVEGFLRIHEDAERGSPVPAPRPPLRLARPALFRSTASWQALQHAFAHEDCPSRKEISVAVAHPFGDPVSKTGGSLRYPNKDTLDKWAQPPPSANPPGKGCANPLDALLALCRAADTSAPLDWLAVRSGGSLLFPAKHPALPGAPDDPLLSWEHTMVQLAELDATIARSLLDSIIDSTELARLRKDWAGVVAWMEAFVEEW